MVNQHGRSDRQETGNSELGVAARSFSKRPTAFAGLEQFRTEIDWTILTRVMYWSGARDLILM